MRKSQESDLLIHFNFYIIDKSTKKMSEVFTDQRKCIL